MIALWDTTGNEVVKALAAERRSAGGVASGLALTLIVVVDEKRVREAEAAATIAAAAHPCRLLIVVRAGRRRGTAESGSTPRSSSAAGSARARPSSCACTAGSRCTPSRWSMPLLAPGRAGGDLVARRAAGADRQRLRWAWSPTAGSPTSPRPPTRSAALRQRADDYAPGDTDLAWTRITPWRTLVAGAFDTDRRRRSPAPRSSAPPTDPTAALMSGWLAARLGISPPRRPSRSRGMRAVELRLRQRRAELASHREDGTAAVQPHRPAGPVLPLAGGRSATSWPRSCAGSTPTSSTRAALERGDRRRPGLDDRARPRGCTSGRTRPGSRRADARVGSERAAHERDGRGGARRRRGCWPQAVAARLVVRLLDAQAARGRGRAWC